MTSEIKQRIVYVLTRINKADDDDTDIYVGSTSLSLNDRLRLHRNASTKAGNENNKLYTRMRTVGVQNWEIIPLLSRTCDIKTIRGLERKWCKIMAADLNTNLPITTPEERNQYNADYYASNKEAILKRNANYREANKEAISKYQADYREDNKDAIKQYNADYYASNKEAILKRNANYREVNKDAIKQYNADYRKLNKQKERYRCDICDKAFESNKDLKRHFKTSKHFWKYIYSVD